MARPYETVRTDRLAYLKDEAIPTWRNPEHCIAHRVSWWSDEPTLEEELGHPSQCPCCDGAMPIRMLLILEAMRFGERLSHVEKTT